MFLCPIKYPSKSYARISLADHINYNKSPTVANHLEFRQITEPAVNGVCEEYGRRCWLRE